MTDIQAPAPIPPAASATGAETALSTDTPTTSASTAGALDQDRYYAPWVVPLLGPVATQLTRQTVGLPPTLDSPLSVDPDAMIIQVGSFVASSQQATLRVTEQAIRGVQKKQADLSAQQKKTLENVIRNTIKSQKKQIGKQILKWTKIIAPKIAMAGAIVLGGVMAVGTLGIAAPAAAVMIGLAVYALTDSITADVTNGKTSLSIADNLAKGVEKGLEKLGAGPGSGRIASLVVGVLGTLLVPQAAVVDGRFVGELARGVVGTAGGQAVSDQELDYIDMGFTTATQVATAIAGSYAMSASTAGTATAAAAERATSTAAHASAAGNAVNVSANLSGAAAAGGYAKMDLDSANILRDLEHAEADQRQDAAQATRLQDISDQFVQWLHDTIKKSTDSEVTIIDILNSNANSRARVASLLSRTTA